jgi:endogenous inhibitor of DNA gyrase (YacG/DUF329 family)
VIKEGTMPKCPICKGEARKGDKAFPFCSERCKVTDLGSWAAEKYRVPSQTPLSEEQSEGAMKQDKKGEWEH